MTVQRPPRPAWVLPGLVALALAVGGVTGAVLYQRGPDPAFLPVMAERPVVMPDGRSFHAQRFEVTVAEWNACAADGGCGMTLRARPGLDPVSTPATGLNLSDAQQYVAWVNKVTGHAFRLPTAAEWAAMAAPVLKEAPKPRFTDPSLAWAADYLTEGLTPRALKPQGSFSTTPNGISDLDGSVWEWTQDCYAATDDITRCPAFFVGGEHVAVMSYLVRDPARGGCAVGSPPAHLGLRLVADRAI